MSSQEKVILLIICINSIVAILYLCWGTVIPYLRKKKLHNNSQGKYIIIFIIMLLCPVVGPLFFFMGNILFYLFFFQQADLSDVIFSKARKESHLKDDGDAKMNLVPLEEAIAVSDSNSLRRLMMNVIKGDVQKSLASVSLALNSEDSEAAHYAASVLRDELNEFRENVQKMYTEIKKNYENQSQYCTLLIEYMNGILLQKVFIPMEQEQYVHLMSEIGEILYQKGEMTSIVYEWICLRLLDIREYEKAEEWSGRALEAYPWELSSYTCRLKIYFNMQEKDKFFKTMEDLKNSKIIIDSETLELIRVFM